MRRSDRVRTRGEFEGADRCRMERLDTMEFEEARQARGTHACPNFVYTFKLIWLYTL
jgi:hypothetical protein